ncbi:glycosyltransferase family 39 protein [Verrucomicrobiales bacterium]|nr:glycosyltransferase family 39 protein [Verrucomicrobiales bacterium]
MPAIEQPNVSLQDEQAQVSSAAMIRRALFLILLIGLSLFYIMIDFRGLSTADGIDQAQIAREIARDNGFSTKAVRPVSLWQTNEHRVENGEGTAGFVEFQDTYHPPLNPLFNSVLLRVAGKDNWVYDGDKPIFPMDILISAGSIVLLLCSIGVSYLLISRIFDARIAGVTAFLMLLCELLWKFSQTGLPQMLMLFIFSFALHFFYKAIENAQEDKPVILWSVLAGGFFGLLALSHWLTVWMFAGALIFAAIYFRPRGVAAVAMFAIFAVIVSTWLIRNGNVSGDPAGIGKYAFYGGIGAQSEAMVMRNLDPESEPFTLEGIISKTIGGSIRQFSDIFRFLGAVVVAPLFFLSLLHPFKRKEIADFRWCILLMWVFGVIGMALFGLPNGETDKNQLHILFLPIMTAYGLAFLSILWNRMELPLDIPIVRNGHFILAILLSSLPLVLTLPTDIKRGMYSKDRKAVYPPYFPPTFRAIASTLDGEESANDIIVSDVPWAVAWYGDRTSIWLPRTVEQFDDLYTYAADKNQPLAGIMLTPETTNARLAQGIVGGEYEEWAPLILQGAASNSTIRNSRTSFSRFPFSSMLNAPDGIFYNNEIVYFTEPGRVSR